VTEALIERRPAKRRFSVPIPDWSPLADFLFVGLEEAVKRCTFADASIQNDRDSNRSWSLDRLARGGSYHLETRERLAHHATAALGQRM